MLFNATIILLTVAAMEVVAYLAHKHVMHGFGWGWHASHHAPRRGAFEKNDLFALVFAAIAIALIWLGTRGHAPLQWVGAGMTAYGALYFVAHDGLVHRRWPLRFTPRRGYLKRLVQAHRLHHAVDSREGAVSFGFLWAPSPQRLREQLQQLQTLRSQRRGSGARRR
jgi:beta-carotene 3-hydroxylase